MPPPPVSGAEPGFPGDPVSPAYPRLGPAAGSWRETRQTRRSPVLRNQVKNEKNTKNEHHAAGSGWPCGPVQARSQRQMLLALTRGDFFSLFFCNCRPLHRTPVIERTQISLRKTATTSTPYIEPECYLGVKRHRKLRCTCPFFPIPSQFCFVAGGSQHKKKIRKNHDKSRQYVQIISLLVH